VRKNTIKKMSKYFAELKNNIVQRVIVADDIQWCISNLGGEWVETFIDRDDKNYAGVGHTYHSDKDNFSEPKPFTSWTLDSKLKWKAPKDCPKDDMYKWNDKKQDWVKIKIK
jgi:hypothetical protein